MDRQTKIINGKKALIKTILNYFESSLSVVVVLAVIAYVLSYLSNFHTYDWKMMETFYDFINFILLSVVGIEVAKLLITQDIYSISNLLTFVVARKMLKPDISAEELVFGVISFAVLFFIHVKFIQKKQRV